MAAIKQVATPVNESLEITDFEHQRQIASVLTRYEKKLCELIRYDNFEYTCDSLGQHFVVGWPATHRCSYELAMGTIHCGEVTVTREVPFRESELKALENCLSDLFRLLLDTARKAP